MSWFSNSRNMVAFLPGRGITCLVWIYKLKPSSDSQEGDGNPYGRVTIWKISSLKLQSMTLCKFLALSEELRPRCWKQEPCPKQGPRSNQLSLKGHGEQTWKMPRTHSSAACLSVSFPQETVILTNWLQGLPTRRINNLKEPRENKTTLETQSQGLGLGHDDPGFWLGFFFLFLLKDNK